MEYFIRLDISIQLNLGELVELLLEFLGSVVVVLLDLDRVLLEICVEKVECLHH